jgi:hypothetical protein
MREWSQILGVQPAQEPIRFRKPLLHKAKIIFRGKSAFFRLTRIYRRFS